MDSLDGHQATVVFVTVTLQLLLFRAGQSLKPSLYFLTADLIERPRDVGVAAVAWRLAIPTLAGSLVFLLAGANARELAVVSGATAWFLVLWPIFWLPAGVSESNRGLIWSVLVLFWVAYATLPLLGFGVVETIQSVTTDAGIERSQLLYDFVLVPSGQAPLLVLCTLLWKALTARQAEWDLEDDDFLDVSADNAWKYRWWEFEERVGGLSSVVAVAVGVWLVTRTLHGKRKR